MIMRSLLIMCALLTAISLPARGQTEEVTVEASVSDERATMGGGVLYTILVKGSIEAAEPVLGDMEGFDVEYLGPMTSTQSTIVLRNGTPRQVRTAKTTFRYLLTPTREGAVRISPATVVVDGKQFETQAIWIEATRPQEMEDFKFRLTTDTVDVYVNQPIAVRATWYVGASVQSYVWNAPNSDAFRVILPPSTRTTSAQGGGNLVPVRIGREEVYGTRDSEILAGRAFTTVSVDLIVMPIAPGEAILGPMTIQFDRPVRTQNAFIRTTVNRREIVASNELSFTVQSAPSGSAPAGFGGLVGYYEIDASINTKDVNVGDPIELTIQVVGDPFVIPGAAPDLSTVEAFDGLFKLSPDGWREESSGHHNERIYRTTVRATHDDVDEVPAIPVHFFDPESGTYRTATSAPLPLVVRPTREITAADAIGVLATATVERSPLISKRAGLPANRTGLAVLRNQNPSIIAFVTSPLGIALVGGPALIYGGVLLGAGRVRRRHDVAHRRRRALAHARRHLKSGPSSKAAAHAIQTYIADTFSLHDRAITGHDCLEVLTPVSPEIATKFKAILDAQEIDSFGSTDQSHTFSIADVRADLIRVDRLLRKESP